MRAIWFLSPDDSISRASTQQTLCHWNHAVDGLSSQGKAVTCGPKAIPVEKVDGTFTGATHHLLPILQGNRAKHVCGATSDQVPITPSSHPTQLYFHKCDRGEVSRLGLREQLKPASLDVEDTEAAISTVERAKQQAWLEVLIEGDM